MSLRRGSSVLIGGAFERLFCPEGREFEQANLQKFKCLGGGCPGGMLNFRIDRRIITSASKLPRSFISGNPNKMPVKCQYKFLTRLIFLFSGSSCYLLTSERDEDNPFKQSNNFYFVFVNERRFKFIQANSQ